ncbi:MAG: right-handed parallel beta-helix repeat-containing protein [Candidatus Acidiferrales bacterium]
MSRILSKLMLVLAVASAALSFGAAELHATTTYIVGTCKAGTQFSSIQAALDAAPSPNVVEVCPGIYAEQITIINAVTIEALSIKNSSYVHITVPSGGLTTNTTINGGATSAAAHVFVKNATGEVNLTGLAVDSAGNNVPTGAALVGILYQHSPGTINHVIAVNQVSGQNTGYGIYMEGGSSNPTVTVENCSVHDFDFGGIYVTGPNGPTAIVGPDVTENVTGQITAKVTNNFVNTTEADGTINMLFGSSTVDTVTGNVSAGADRGAQGLSIDANTGSTFSDNTIIDSAEGITLLADGPSVTGNKLYNDGSNGDGAIAVFENLKTSKITGNTIQNSQFYGINLGCYTVGTLVNSNTFEYLAEGFLNAPSGFSGSGTYIATPQDVVPCP